MNIPDKIIIAGNVVTPNMTEELILKVLIIIKVGIGPVVCVLHEHRLVLATFRNN